MASANEVESSCIESSCIYGVGLIIEDKEYEETSAQLCWMHTSRKPRVRLGKVHGAEGVRYYDCMKQRHVVLPCHRLLTQRTRECIVLIFILQSIPLLLMVLDCRITGSGCC
jgi:hypothetical protein